MKLIIKLLLTFQTLFCYKKNNIRSYRCITAINIKYSGRKIAESASELCAAKVKL